MNGEKNAGKYCNLCNHEVREEDPLIPCGGKPDPCLGVIPGVIHACCGHGVIDQAYVVLANAAPGTILPKAGKTYDLRAQRAIDFFSLLMRGPNFQTRYVRPD